MGFCKGIIGLAACLTIGHALPANGQDKVLEEMAWSEDSIRHYAARMLMVGFKGATLDDESDAARYVRDLRVGGIVLFDIDLTGTAKKGSRNIQSPEQVRRLTDNLRQRADYDLLIAVDQEGGQVNRLKTDYGFPPTVSAEYLGKLDNQDTTLFYGGQTAKELARVGINLNFAPVVDIKNPDSPALGARGRCFSEDTAVVTRNAAWFVDAHHAQGVLTALKHFPGHGNAVDDSHYGFTDVTKRWKPEELAPFRELIWSGRADMVMMAHIFNERIDPEYPATLSRVTIQDLLRGELGFDGVVITDDMYMNAIIERYSIEEAVVLAINAGVDMMIFGNNINTGFVPDRPDRIIRIIVDAVKAGKIHPERLVEANRRIERLAKSSKK